MNSDPNPRPNAGGDHPTQDAPAEHRHDPVYRYVDSGIQERHGEVPLWLWIVVVGLIVWGIYYLVAYWSPSPQ